MSLDHKIAHAFKTSESMKPGDAFIMAEDILAEAPDDYRALFLMGLTFLRSDHPGAAYSFYKRSAEINPDEHRTWNNLAKACQELFMYDEAEEYLKRSLALKSDNAAALQNMAVVCLNQGRPQDVFVYSQAAEKLDPKLIALTRDSSAQAHFSLGQWGQGWDDFHHTLGNKYRKEKHYPGDEEWNGPHGMPANPLLTDAPVVVYGEQGIGDEIFFSSLLRGLSTASIDLHLDCDPRLEGLFRRSFAGIKVHGTRNQDAPTWGDPTAKYLKSPIAGVGRWTCRDESHWDGSPYLEPCPFRKYQWQSLFRRGGRKPVIGIAWTGGAIKTGARDKSMGIDTLGPLFRAFPGAQFVSLEHKPRASVVGRYAAENQVHVAHFPWATETADYDNTAAIVASCDVVVSVMTSVAHLAGALGVPTWMMLPVRPQPAWRYHGRGPGVPYYDCMTLVRQRAAGEWAVAIDDVIGGLRAHFAEKRAVA